MASFPSTNLNNLAKPRPKRPGSAVTNIARNAFIHQRALDMKPQPARDHVYGTMNPKIYSPGDMNDESLQYAMFSREELEVTLRVTKTKLKNAENTIVVLKNEVHQYETEVIKQQRRLENFLEPQSGLPPPSGELRRELEKLLLIRQMKTQNMMLRNALIERTNEMDLLKKSQKGSRVMEMANEREEYYLETLRLKQIVMELRETLQQERQRKLSVKKMVPTASTTDSMRKEVALMTAGYQQQQQQVMQKIGGSSGTGHGHGNISSNGVAIREPLVGTRGVIRSPVNNAPPSSSHITHSAVPVTTHTNTIPNQTTTSSSRRPQSATKGRNVSNTVPPVVNEKQPHSRGSQPPPPQQQQQPQQKNRIDELDFFTGEIDQDAEQLNINLQGGDSLTVLSMQQPPLHSHQPPTTTYALESSTSLDDLSVAKPSLASHNNNNNNNNNIPNHLKNISPQIAQSNDPVKSTAARVIDLPSAGRTTDESTSQVVYDDGDGNGDDYDDGYGDDYAQEEEGERDDKNDRQVTENETPELPYDVGDKVEADYYGEGDYYPATVTAVMTSTLRDNQEASYALLYDDGDTEDNVPTERMRLVMKASTPKNAQGQGQGQGTARGTGTNTITTAASSSSSDVGTGAGVTSRTTTLPPQDPSASSTHTPAVVVVPSSSSGSHYYSVGQRVEGRFDKGDEWYKATVTHLGTKKGVYTLLYDDGDVEDDVSEGCMRVLAEGINNNNNNEGTSSSNYDTSIHDNNNNNDHDNNNGPSSYAVQPVASPTTDAFLDNFLDELSDDGDEGGYGAVPLATTTATPTNGTAGNEEEEDEVKIDEDDDEGGDYEEDFD